ncbi:MAG: hypothetical protein IJD04_04110 [Desulfovibrionaceae bacterium]|nr:hypothetical protein [Desulfovibrionaceae bacterium]
MLKVKYAFLKPVVVLVLFMACSACTGQQVNLAYNALGPSMGPDSDLPAVMIEEFQNVTGQEGVGADSDGEVYTANRPPAQWISEALTDELVRLGVRAGYSPYASGSDYIIRGKLERFWVEQIGTAQYSVKISVSIQLPQDANGVAFTKTYNAEQSSVIMPTDAALSELVEDTLRDVVVPAAQEIKNHLQKI